MKILKRYWKYSRWRFYILNFRWNLKFWLFSKKVYKNVSYYTNANNFTSDFSYTVIEKKKLESKQRFAGLMFQNNIYWDNPGMPILEPDVWKAWKKKGLIK